VSRKRLVVIAAVAASIVGAAVIVTALCVLILLPLAQAGVRNAAHSYEPGSSESVDGKYVLHTEKFESSTGPYAVFTIRSSADQTVIFRCHDKYRTMDLKSIAFDTDSNDVYVSSADLGTHRYAYQNGGWAKDLGDDADRSTDTWSSAFEGKDEKLAFLSCYLVSFSEILDAEYHIVYYDNSTGRLPAPSDWDIRVALKIRPEDAALWMDGYERIEGGEGVLDLWGGLSAGALSWKEEDAVFYKRPERDSYLVAFPGSGLILKAVPSETYGLSE
jgi:hypothetical protein